MARTIILTEAQNKVLMRQMLREAAGYTKFGYDTYNDSDVTKLRSISTDRYRDISAENAYAAWENVGFDKDSKEYAKWCERVQYFMNVELGGIVDSLGLKNKRNITNLHTHLLDPNWMRNVITKTDKEAEIGTNKNGQNKGYRCIYTLILTLYANKCMWNDFFFNPEFKWLHDLIFTDQVAFAKCTTRDEKLDKAGFITRCLLLNPSYKNIMPLQQVRELLAYGNNNSNAKPDLFYDPNWSKMGYSKLENDRKVKELEDHPMEFD